MVQKALSESSHWISPWW